MSELRYRKCAGVRAIFFCRCLHATFGVAFCFCFCFLRSHKHRSQRESSGTAKLHWGHKPKLVRKKVHLKKGYDGVRMRPSSTSTTPLLIFRFKCPLKKQVSALDIIYGLYRHMEGGNKLPLFLSFNARNSTQFRTEFTVITRVITVITRAISHAAARSRSKVPALSYRLLTAVSGSLVAAPPIFLGQAS